MMKTQILFGLVCIMVAVSPVPAAGEITDLDQLLESVRQEQQQLHQQNLERERRFLQQKDQQKSLLKQARSDFHQLQKKNNPLVKQIDDNNRLIKELKAHLADENRAQGNLQGVFREFVGDFAESLQGSLVSAQLPERKAQLKRLRDNQQPATIQEMETLWLLVQQEMTEAGKLARFAGPVVAPDGTTTYQNILRAGAFTIFSAGNFQRYIPETGELLTLNRQPAGLYLREAKQFVAAGGERLPMVIDPTGGSMLGALSYTPTLRERIEQGGVIGLIILGCGLLGGLLTLWRLSYLGITSYKVRRQLKAPGRPSGHNPLGRVMEKAGQLSGLRGEGEALQFKLDEAILAEIPQLERSHGLLKLLAAIAPLLGLLGTVTGMILTFQAISLHGSGDPKLMANGISQALVTTVLGLIVAIPLLFSHSLVSSLARNMVQVLDEQSAGILARLMEQADDD